MRSSAAPADRRFGALSLRVAHSRGAMQLNLASLFPKSVSVGYCRPEDIAGRLYPEELLLIDGSVAKRRREFIAGRLLARQALARLGRPATPILAHDRRPLWPPGTIGSITHASGQCGAAVALVEDLAGIGLDVEVLGALTSELQRQVLTEPERDWVHSLSAATQAHWATATFSQKGLLQEPGRARRQLRRIPRGAHQARRGQHFRGYRRLRGARGQAARSRRHRTLGGRAELDLDGRDPAAQGLLDQPGCPMLRARLRRFHGN